MKILQEQEVLKNRIDEEVKNFYAGVVSYGYLDVKRAIEIFLEVAKSGDDLAEEVLRYSEDTGTALKDIDVCYIAYETILQEARNKISEVLNFDFLNDGNLGIYTYGNYMCSSYDNTEETKEKLRELLETATEEERAEILEDKATNWFLKEIGVI